MNFVDSLGYLNELYNPLSFILSLLEEKGIEYINYNDYLKKRDSNSLQIEKEQISSLLPFILTNMTKANSTISPSPLESYNKIIDARDKVIGDITNYAILSLFLIISSIMTFSLRSYTGNWRIDMTIYFIVKYTFNFFERSIW